MYGYGGDHEKRNRGKFSSDRYDLRSLVSMVVSICHTSVLTWTIAPTLKLLSTRVDGATRPWEPAGQSRKKNYRFPKAFFPALARSEWRRKFEFARGLRQSFAKVLTILRRDLSPLVRFFSPSDIEQEQLEASGNGSSEIVFVYQTRRR